MCSCQALRKRQPALFLQVHINGALEYDLVGEPLMAETFSSRTEMLAELK